MKKKSASKPLKSQYLEDRFGETFHYIDSIMNNFMAEYDTNERIYEAKDVLDQSFEAKLTAKVSDLQLRRILSQDYSRGVGEA